jgi:hypothetical protein
MMALHSFRCQYDSTRWQTEIDDNETLYSPCPKCGHLAARIVNMAHIPLSMGADTGFPTMADKWARIHKQQGRLAARLKKEHGDIR